MVLQLHTLLKLPPSLRWQTILNLTARPLQKKLYIQGNARPFSIARISRARKTSRPPTTKQPPPPSPSKPAESLKRDPTKPPEPLQRNSNTRLPTKISAIFNRGAGTDRILLYRAANHKPFVFLSWLSGLTFIGGSVVNISFTNKANRMPFYTRMGMAIVALFMAVLGTVFLLAPARMIRSVSLIKDASTGMELLRFEAKKYPLLTHGKTVDVPIGDGASYDLSTVERATFEKFLNVPLEYAEEFNADGNSKHKLRLDLGQEVRRMFNRSSMTYLRIGEDTGYWKLDMRDCAMLDMGRPMFSLMKGARFDRSLFGRIIDA